MPKKPAGAMRRAPRPASEDAFIQGAAATAADNAAAAAKSPKAPAEPTVKTSFDLPKSLHRDLKVAAAADGVALRDVVIESLRRWLKDRPSP